MISGGRAALARTMAALCLLVVAALAPADIAQPIRLILRSQKNALVMLAEVTPVGFSGLKPLPTASGEGVILIAFSLAK